MRLVAFLLFLLVAGTKVPASTYSYPKSKKPAVSLMEACEIAAAMLKSRGEEKSYHSYMALLLGDEEQSGDGAWTIDFSDTEGNEISAHVPLRENVCYLQYSKSAARKACRPEITFLEFSRDGTKVSVLEKRPPGKAK